MTDAVPPGGPDPRADNSLFPRTAGERLRAAREAQKLSLADVAARTRVPTRHLEAIESGDYSSLPTPTYAIGFAKAYARAVGEDEAAIARDVRGHTAAISRDRQEYQPYEMDDPTRVPPRGLALLAAAVAVIILVGAVLWFGSGWFQSGPAAPETSVAADQGGVAGMPTPAAATPVPALDTGGQVTLTALDRVWVRVHDSSGKTLFEKTMNPGDHFDLPPDASRPVLSVGRPDKLRVTLNGTALAPLGSGAQPIKDMPIDAATLAARPTTAAPGNVAPAMTMPAAAPTPAPTAAPTPAASPSPHRTSRPRVKPTPRATPSNKPLDLDLKPTAPPVPAPTGIY